MLALTSFASPKGWQPNATAPAFVFLFFLTVKQILIPAPTSLQEFKGADVKMLRKLYRDLVCEEEDGGAPVSNNANCWRGRIRTRGIWSSRSFRVHQVGGLTEMTSLPSESSGSGDSSFGRIFLPVVFGGVNPGVLKHGAPVVRRDPMPGQHLFSLLVRVGAGFLPLLLWGTFSPLCFSISSFHRDNGGLYYQCPC